MGIGLSYCRVPDEARTERAKIARTNNFFIFVCPFLLPYDR